MGHCVSSVPPDTNRANQTATSNEDDKDTTNAYKPTSSHARQLEYPRARNEFINNPYSINDWIEVQEKISMQWVVSTIIDKQNNWIRIYSQSPNMQFTDKLHLVRDGSRIRQLGAALDDHNDNTPKEDKHVDGELDSILHKNGFQLIYEIKYDETDSAMDTIYKSFEYQLFRNDDCDQLKENILQFINDEENDEFFSQQISNWSQCKENHDLLTDKDHLLILSHFYKLNVILHQINNCELEIIQNDQQNENDIHLLFVPKTKHYKLMSMTMHAMIKLITDENDDDYTKWTVEQILKWINIIEFGAFRDNKFENLKQGIQKLEIDGTNIIKMNDLTLKSMGISDEFDQKLLIENIEKLVSTKDNKHNNLYKNGNNNNNDIIEEETYHTTPGGGGRGRGIGGGGGGGNDYFEIPEEYLDPIHYTIMRDPVLSIVSGHTFERQSIVEWINTNHTDPMNQKQLNINQLVPNRTLREAIDRFIKVYGAEFDEITETKQ